MQEFNLHHANLLFLFTSILEGFQKLSKMSLTRSLYGLEAIKRVLILSSLGAVPRRTVLEEIGKFSPRS
jgi:hypothetical protein